MISTNSSAGRSVMKLYLTSGLVLVVVMMLVGLTMGMVPTQWLSISPGLL